jgi:hypothetical protein
MDKQRKDAQDGRHDRQRITSRYSKIHLARRLKSTLTDLYVDGKVAQYVKVVREYNQLVKTL